MTKGDLAIRLLDAEKRLRELRARLEATREEQTNLYHEMEDVSRRADGLRTAIRTIEEVEAESTT